MKIIHTSDWHLGKQLQKVDFSEDMDLFFNWLTDYIRNEGIDVLLMSGDLFDQANPSQQALKQYYELLKKLIPLDCKVIITGGNHDSPQVINAPKEILNLLDITVIGGKADTIADLFIEIKKENEKVVIAAVPFLRDRDIRNATPGESYSDKIDEIKKGLASYFTEVNTYYKQNYLNSPYILMGHLYAHGVSVSESEREIQIGNQAGIEAKIFGSEPHYVALGHIHKPQILGGKNNIRYSGSPIPMSFSEKNDQKQIVHLELKKEELEIKTIPVPSFRKLVTLKGSYLEVSEKIQNYKTESILSDLAELIIVEEKENVETIRLVEELALSEPGNGLQIVKNKIEFNSMLKGSSEFFTLSDDISSFTPVQLFEKRLEQESNLENRTELIQAFKDILNTIQND